MSGSRFKKLWSEIIEAISGSEKDFTQIPLKNAVFLLAVPMVIEMIMESIFALVDIYFVSKLGADAVATVGITETLLTLIYAIAFGLSAATTALVSRRIGEKHSGEASQEAIQAIITTIAIALTIMVPGVIFASDLLQLMGASAASVNEYSIYPATMFGGNIIIMLLFVNNAIFRGAGDASIAMKVLLVGNLINIILDPILISVYGIAGAALATNIGRGIAVIYQLYVLYYGNSRINLKLIRFYPDWRRIKHIIAISLGGIGQSLIATLSWVLMMWLVARFGSQVVAGYTIAIRIMIFTLLPSWGLSNAASTLAGQNLGANHPERAEKSVWQVAWINVIGLGLIGILLVLLSENLVSFFTDERDVIDFGSTSLKIMSYGFSLYGLGMVMTQAFNGAGDTITPTWINFICFWMIEVPLAWALSTQTSLNEKGVFYAIIIAESIMAIFATVLFKRGKWKLKKV